VAIFGGVGTDIKLIDPLGGLGVVRATGSPWDCALDETIASGTSFKFGGCCRKFRSRHGVVFRGLDGVASVSAAEPSLYLAQNGQASAADSPAASFTLTDQFDRSYTLDEHHGRYTLLAF